ncbi:MAG TPA: YCF48-related protein, partial [Pirellulales bacterium]|nr:YCF48-related protein [Pirellulales bacterium]
MAGHGRRAWFAVWMLAAAMVASDSAALRAQDVAGPNYNAQPATDTLPQWRSMQDDAELTAVCFLDREHGWAVGDRGVIWHTSDAGRSWQLQASGVRARLAAIQMFDAQRGLAVGSVSQDYTHATGGVLLRTGDGGQTWQLDASLMLPALRGVKFFDPAHGWAFGETSAMFPTGAAFTDDAGRSWTPATGEQVQGWLAADFINPATGAVAGHRATLAAIARRKIGSSAGPDIGLREARKLKLNASGDGWLVGDAGLLLATHDGGEHWEPPTDTKAIDTKFDWRTVAVRGTKVWIAGEPGTRILYSPDGGATWVPMATGQSLPINDLVFVDDEHGWAVGALGTILATHDGGRSWQRQRSGGARAAILAILSEPEAAPLELFARLSANDGYLAAVEFVGRRDLEDPRPVLDTLDLRAADGLSILGVSATRMAPNFPLRQAGVSQSASQLVEAWDRSNGGHAVEQLEAILVRQIRMWRPEIIVTHATSPRGRDTLGHLINQVVVRAAEGAGNSERFAEQLAGQGLEPWKVKKVLGMLADGQPGRLNITTSQLAARWGCSIADLADRARGLILDRYAEAPATLGFQLALDFLPQGTGSHDFTSGVVLHPGSDARRALGDVPDLGTDLMRRVAQKHRNVQAILAHAARSATSRDAVPAAAGDLTFGLDETAAGEVLFDTAQYAARHGQWSEAADLFDLLVKRYPRHRLAGASLVWLLRYASSGEIAQKQRSAAGGGGAADSKAAEARSAYAAAISRQIEQQFPTLFAEPEIQLPWLAATGGGRDPGQTKRMFASLAGTRPHDAWWACAEGEAWLADRANRNAAPKPQWRVKTSGARPKLDGKLDEEFWQSAEPIALHSRLGDDHDWPAELLAARDGEHLYLAIRCRQIAAAEPTAAGTRTRDPDLDSSERVELFLDVDRDYATWYHLVIDQRGWVAEDCWGDKSWNPRWFVAVRSEPTCWQIEAAIPLAELTSDPVTVGRAWACNVVRILPGRGVQAWSLPADVQ